MNKTYRTWEYDTKKNGVLECCRKIECRCYRNLLVLTGADVPFRPRWQMHNISTSQTTAPNSPQWVKVDIPRAKLERCLERHIHHWIFDIRISGTRLSFATEVEKLYSWLRVNAPLPYPQGYTFYLDYLNSYLLIPRKGFARWPLPLERIYRISPLIEELSCLPVSTPWVSNWKICSTPSVPPLSSSSLIGLSL